MLDKAYCTNMNSMANKYFDLTVKLLVNKALPGKHENQNLLDNFLSNTANFTNYEKNFSYPDFIH